MKVTYQVRNGQWVVISQEQMSAAQYLSQSGQTTQTHALAEGGIMSAHGRMPLHSYQEGGVANRPQMALFGEGSQPEAFVPLKGGKIPVALANDNAGPGLQKAITAILTALAKQEERPTIAINAPLVHFAAEPTRDEVRASAFQAAQEMRRLMAG